MDSKIQVEEIKTKNLTVYKCNICSKKSEQKSHHTRHLKTKKHKLNKYHDNSIVKINSKHHYFGSENIGKIVVENEHNAN